MRKILLLTLAIIYQLLAIGHPAAAQYKVLLNFHNLNGAYPYDDVILSGDTLYGMTSAGGSYGHGTIFSIETSGNNYNKMHDFNDSDGSGPYGDLTLYRDTLYGMTYLGGLYGKGVIFSILPDGSGYTLLRNLGATANDPVNPIGNLSITGDTMYGMSFAGGVNGLGNIFSIGTAGNNYTDLYDFNSPGGIAPQANLIVSGNKLYGTAELGGPDNEGILFSFNTSTKVFATLYNFGGTRGENPMGSLLLSGSTLYGMTTYGGNNADSAGNIFAINDTGNGFTDLFDFDGANGKYPYGSLLFSAGKMYGMTTAGGSDSAGIIFSADTTGSGFTALYNFNKTQGAFPHGCLLLSKNVFYGMAYTGGTSGYGVVFSFADSSTGINELQTKPALLSVYPNPGKGFFTLELRSEKNSIKNIDVFNVFGEKVYSQLITSNTTSLTIDLSSQLNGVYLYRLIADSKDLVGEGKLVIQK